ncbi:MAG: hypothetical protein WD278_10980, partial [Pirellulales bacterium]
MAPPRRRPTRRSPVSIGIDPRLRGIPPALLRDRRDRPIRVSSPVFEHTVIQLGHLTSPFGRPLTADEVELGRSIYGRSLALSRVRVVEAAVANAPTTLGDQIRISPGFSLADAEGRGVLIHELGHVW